MSTSTTTPTTLTTTGMPTAGLRFSRVFSNPEVSPYDELTWETRTAEITGEDGKPVFRQEGVEVPAGWSQRATNIVFDKYAYGRLGTPERESSVRQIVGRVVGAITTFGVDHDYFTPGQAPIFAAELTWLLLNQYAAFNSPVWFNVGCRPGTGYAWDFERGDVVPCSEIDEPRYTGSACFIVGVQDSIDSISRNAATEMAIFKYGSGAGSDRSRLRSCREPVTGGGKASGPVSFMRIYDQVGAVTKSGGISRRAAKMEILRCDHPDIMEFIRCKGLEEKKAQALIAAGYEANFNGEAYNSVLFQNSNLSVRATDAFLRAVEADEDWQTVAVATGKPEAADGQRMPVYKAGTIMDEIAAGTWRCGDPGLQYDDTIQRWHTLPNTGYLWASNPCSEYMSIDDSACNLASLNLLKFRRDDGTFDVERFRAACRIFAVAQDILVDLGSYPTPEIARNAHRFRQLGLGYTNLGSLIMAAGRPYDSDEGRALAGAITAIMTGQVYLTSAEMAGTEGLGAFDGFAENREAMLQVMGMHADAVTVGWDKEADYISIEEQLWSEANEVWHAVMAGGEQYGYRNAQATVLAPTGTISFMMDADTTGIEPALGLIVIKNLWGRGQLRMVNQTVPMALKSLGYDGGYIHQIEMYVNENGTVYGCNSFDPVDLPVFDCALPAGPSGRSIHYRGHLKMMAAVQPFISGAISKTVNMPADSTVADIRNAYMEGWKLGLKAVAIYRDGSKGSQPISTSKGDKSDDRRGDFPGTDPDAVGAERRVPGDGPLASDLGVLSAPRDQSGNRAVQGTAPRRERLPDTRQSLTHKFRLGNVEGFLTVGYYPDGRPGELFISIAKAGSTVNGLVGDWAKMVSVALQYGVPMEVIAEKFRGGRFEPSGMTRNPDVPIATSVTDYVARWMGNRYQERIDKEILSRISVGQGGQQDGPQKMDTVSVHDGQTCPECGNMMVRTGSCYTCSSCGANSGCG